MLSDFDRRFSGKTHHFVRVFLCEFGGGIERRRGGSLRADCGKLGIGKLGMGWPMGGKWKWGWAWR